MLSFIQFGIILLGAGWEESQKSRGTTNGQNVVESGADCFENVEGGNNDQQKVQGIIVENGECGGFVIGNFVFLPQNSANNGKYKI